MDMSKMMLPGQAAIVNQTTSVSDSLRQIADKFDQDATKPNRVTIVARMDDQVMFFWAARGEDGAPPTQLEMIEPLFADMMDGLDALCDDFPEIAAKMCALHEIKRTMRMLQDAISKAGEGGKG